MPTITLSFFAVHTMMDIQQKLESSILREAALVINSLAKGGEKEAHAITSANFYNPLLKSTVNYKFCIGSVWFNERFLGLQLLFREKKTNNAWKRVWWHCERSAPTTVNFVRVRCTAMTWSCEGCSLTSTRRQSPCSASSRRSSSALWSVTSSHASFVYWLSTDVGVRVFSNRNTRKCCVAASLAIISLCCWQPTSPE